MKRKLIKQGINGLTIYLPKKWTDAKGLSSGDELEITEHESTLIISQKDSKKTAKQIKIKAESGRETKRRIPIVNAYRAGYDKIMLEYSGDIKDIQKICGELLVGFELFRISETTYSLESVAEPDYGEFERIVEKIFFILEDVLKNIDSDITSQVHQIQKYDNLLKRMLTKNMLNVSEPFSLWHFLSLITHAARDCIHLMQELDSKFSKGDKTLQEQALEMLLELRKMYQKKDADRLFKLHDMQEKSIKIGEHLLKKEHSMNAHHLLSICRNIYLASSPLYSIINSMTRKK